MSQLTNQLISFLNNKRQKMFEGKLWFKDINTLFMIREKTK